MLHTITLIMLIFTLASQFYFHIIRSNPLDIFFNLLVNVYLFLSELPIILISFPIIRGIHAQFWIDNFSIPVLLIPHLILKFIYFIYLFSSKDYLFLHVIIQLFYNIHNKGTKYLIDYINFRFLGYKLALVAHLILFVRVLKVSLHLLISQGSHVCPLLSSFLVFYHQFSPFSEYYLWFNTFTFLQFFCLFNLL